MNEHVYSFQEGMQVAIIPLLAALLQLHSLDQRFPTWGACTTGGTFKARNRREKYIYIVYFQAFM